MFLILLTFFINRAVRGQDSARYNLWRGKPKVGIEPTHIGYKPIVLPLNYNGRKGELPPVTAVPPQRKQVDFHTIPASLVAALSSAFRYGEEVYEYEYVNRIPPVTAALWEDHNAG